MSDDMINSETWLSEFNSLPEASILLEPQELDQAREISQRSRQKTKRWQTYLSAIALAGFEQWLKQRLPEVKVNKKRCVILEPVSASASTAVCNLIVNGFKVCLVEVGSFIMPTTWIPKAAIDSADVAAQFYVPVIVDEESGRITVHGFLRRDQLKTPLSTEHSDFYVLPTDWFDVDLDRFLLFLDCLDSEAIPITTQSKIAALVQSAQTLVSPVIKFKEQIQQQGQELAEVGWMLVSSNALAGAMRSHSDATLPMSDIDAILTSLQRGGMRMTNEAQKAICKDFEYADLPLRLYVVPATDTVPSEPDEESLIFILKLQDNERLPSGLQLQVSDDEKLISEQTVEGDADFSYCRVYGVSGERFFVTLKFDQAAAFTLEPIEL